METSTKKEVNMEKVNGFNTTAGKIRYLNSEGFSRGEISKILGIRYQWVRNVLITPVKKVK